MMTRRWFLAARALVSLSLVAMTDRPAVGRLDAQRRFAPITITDLSDHDPDRGVHDGRNTHHGTRCQGQLDFSKPTHGSPR